MTSIATFAGSSRSSRTGYLVLCIVNFASLCERHRVLMPIKMMMMMLVVAAAMVMVMVMTMIK